MGTGQWAARNQVGTAALMGLNSDADVSKIKKLKNGV
jgi:hypothetical protein